MDKSKIKKFLWIKFNNILYSKLRFAAMSYTKIASEFLINTYITDG